MLLPLFLAFGDVQNVTLYRITPRNYTGVKNLDSGDPAGDAFFGLYELTTPVLCDGKQSAFSGVTCQNVPILQIPGFNVYEQNIVEIDTRYGDYSECNPDPNNGTFSCTHFHSGGGCWYKNKEYKKNFAGICSEDECSCDIIEKHAVGEKPVSFGPGGGGGPKKNSTLPKQCTDSYFHLPFVVSLCLRCVCSA
jgi:hypothetical protein